MNFPDEWIYVAVNAMRNCYESINIKHLKDTE